jgi:phage shock protein C
MHCTNCGSILDPGAKFCPACGHSTTPGIANPAQGDSFVASTPTRLVRPRKGRKIAGVCLGVANNLNWDVTLVRILWLLLVFGAGTGLVAYIIAWIVIPNGND